MPVSNANRRTFLIPLAALEAKPGWQDSGLCWQNRASFEPPADGSPRSHMAIQYARDICAQCSVRSDCLESALQDAQETEDEIWAGTTQSERKQMRKARQGVAHGEKMLSKRMALRKEEIPYVWPVDKMEVRVSDYRLVSLAALPIPIHLKSETDLACAAIRQRFKFRVSQGKSGEVEAVRNICRQCPMQAECLEFGLMQPSRKQYIYGSMVHSERVIILRVRKSQQVSHIPQVVIAPDTYSGSLIQVAKGSDVFFSIPAENIPFRADWRDDALCSENREPFEISDEDERYQMALRYAKGICAQCSVQSDCLERILQHSDNADQTGIWASTTPASRKAMRKARRNFIGPRRD